MKKIAYLLLIFLSLNSYAATQRVEVMGMVCAFCAQGIEKSLQTIKDVNDVYVNLDNYFVIIESKNTVGIPDEMIKNIIVDAGYDVKKIETINASVKEIRAKYEKK
ncbi:MAG: heavy metal-associated domain-containing protein [Proteobacteria bacterium]|jgi:cation transport ATPase|nr:heavy metal-associated domain-containing protein [Pseudomonadota bacterium]MDA1134158.1 heavy metal-associated domain-containing protein [Pseudomonadota bacterium]